MLSRLPVPGIGKRRTETVSFRIDCNTRLELEDEARRTGVNLNSIASQVFKRYLSWERYANRLKFLPVSKDLLRDLFQAVPMEALERIAKRHGETNGPEEISFVFGEITPSTVLRFVELWASHFDASECRYDGRKHFLTIHHDVNSKFSLFSKDYLSSLIRSTLARESQFEAVGPRSLTITFES